MREVPIASEAEVQAMLARLRRRGAEKATVNPSGATQSPKEKSALQWEKPQKGSTGVRTKCGRYSCCKVVVSGKLHYELWKLAGATGAFTRLDRGSGLDNFLQAQVMAQQDADRA